MFGLKIDRSLNITISQQLTNQIRSLILHGELESGERLPSSRYLAGQLNVARNTVIQVYDQLLAEGYLESRIGSGTYVAALQKYHPEKAVVKQRNTGSLITRPPATPRDYIDFHAGNPDSSLFPRTQWAKLLREVCLDSPPAVFEYRPPEGEWPLRSALADYLFRSKGIECQPEQILIVPGIARAIELLSRLIGQDQGTMVTEDPCLDLVRNVASRAGLKIAPVPVDDSGLQTSQLPEDRSVRLIYSVPSHQFPLGGVLPIARRLQLLTYAREKGAYIIEDDYDSEYRYQGEPIQSLRHLDPTRVIYLGTFSKILSPGLRLGYVIVPPALQRRAYSLMETLGLRASSLEQLALARFITEKMLDGHIYRMKKVYARKRQQLIAALQATFGNQIAISGTNAGLHILVTFLHRDLSSADLVLLRESHVIVDWVEDYAVRKGAHRNQLVLGYGNLTLDRIERGVELIKKAQCG